VIAKDNIIGAQFFCQWPDEERFKTLHLEGAISLDELRSRLDSLPFLRPFFRILLDRGRGTDIAWYSIEKAVNGQV
jgi:hypothetical protein